jgi:hypothetical protein
VYAARPTGVLWVLTRPGEPAVSLNPKGLLGDIRGGAGKGLVSWTWSGPPCGLSFPGLLCLSSDCHRGHCHPALHLSGLLQPAHLVVLSDQECALLRLRLVQCVRPGQWGPPRWGHLLGGTSWGRGISWVPLRSIFPWRI